MIADTNEISSLFVWSFVLVAAILAGLALVTWVKKRVNEPEQPGHSGFSLDDLRALQKSGKLSGEEYERARTRMLAGLKQKSETKDQG